MCIHNMHYIKYAHPHARMQIYTFACARTHTVYNF